MLQVLPRLDAGGAERTTLDVAGAVVQAGGRALVACAGGRMVSELQVLGGVWLPFPADVKNPLQMLMNVRKLAKLIAAERVDVVHARSRAPAWVALGAARIVERPLVTTYHGAYGGVSALKIRYNSVMARGDAVIANSHYTAESILKLYPFARDRLAVIHRGSDLGAFSPGAVDPARVTALRNAWGVAPHERIVLLAAQAHRLEGAAGSDRGGGQAQAGRRALHPGRRPPGARRLCEGTRPADRGARVKGVVTRVGHCADMPAALLAASVVAVPSTEPEAFGRSAVEAQAMGTPVVVSDLGAVPETVLAPPDVGPEARTGWRVPAGDVDALAEALRTALGLGATARDALARRARAHVERNFSLEGMTRATLDVYAAVLGL